jgi:hypothetical protein
MPTTSDQTRARRLAFLRRITSGEIPPPPAEENGVIGPGGEGFVPQEPSTVDFDPSMVATMLRPSRASGSNGNTPERPLLEGEYQQAVQGAFPENRAAAGGLTITSRDLPAEESLRDQLRAEPPPMANRSFRDPNFWKYQAGSRPSMGLGTGKYVPDPADEARRVAAYDAGVARSAAERAAQIKNAVRRRTELPPPPEETPTTTLSAATVRRAIAPPRDEMIGRALERMKASTPQTTSLGGLSSIQMRRLWRDHPETAAQLANQAAERVSRESIAEKGRQTQAEISRGEITGRERITDKEATAADRRQQATIEGQRALQEAEQNALDARHGADLALREADLKSQSGDRKAAHKTQAKAQTAEEKANAAELELRNKSLEFEKRKARAEATRPFRGDRVKSRRITEEQAMQEEEEILNPKPRAPEPPDDSVPPPNTGPLANVIRPSADHYLLPDPQNPKPIRATSVRDINDALDEALEPNLEDDEWLNKQNPDAVKTALIARGVPPALINQYAALANSPPPEPRKFYQAPLHETHYRPEAMGANEPIGPRAATKGKWRRRARLKLLGLA